MLVEPLWWAKAREMHARGRSYGVIARIVKKHHVSVMYAVRPAWRDKRKAVNRARWAAKPAQDRPRRSPEEETRHKVVAAARHEADILSTHPDLVLLAWGQPARREMQSRRAGA